MFQKSKTTNENVEAKLTPNFNQSQLEKYEIDFNSKVNFEIESMVREKNKFQIYQEGFQIQTKAATLVKSAETLLTITTNLKKAYLVNDSRYQIETTCARNNEISRLKSNTVDAINKLSEQLDSSITELNNSYLK
ncbi:hypothetical protein BB561_002742 [Smittium simulii]|uniref:Uncharacterized protein n=1 Tax=Smittium simulii TaxID=133385 RepID=A0A2T9YPD3_9FUNG|nr:hypothetical protein BB561_002742 [Smittium simulii]